jgi:hypothetical protein
MNTGLAPYVILMCCSLLCGCKKKSAPQVPPAPQAPAANPDDLTQQTPEYVKFTIGSTSYSFTPPQSGTWSSFSNIITLNSAPQPNIADLNMNVYSGNNNIVFSLERTDTTRETGYSLSAASLLNSIKEGNYRYSSGWDLNQSIGVGLSFKDSQNITWTTQNFNNSGRAFQGTATFNIVKRITWSDNSFTYNKIKASIACKVYNQNGDSAQVTNGEIIIKFFK